jgi:hypothetical protein
LSISKSIKKLGLIISKSLSVESNFLLELSKTFLKLFLFFTNQESKKLLFKTILGNSEINNSCFSSKLW